MGQKVNPIGFRLGYIGKWSSQWICNKKSCADQLMQDEKIRKYMSRRLGGLSIESFTIEHTNSHLVLTIYTSKPGLIIGKKGEEVDKLKKEINCLIAKSVSINVEEVKKPEIASSLIADALAGQISKRISYNKAVKGVISSCMRVGVKGIKVVVSGRLDGADMARTEKFMEGSVPLQTLRANVDYSFKFVKTIYGIIGIKVWVYLGQIYNKMSLYEKRVNA